MNKTIKNQRKRKRRQSRRGILPITFVILLLMCVVSIKGIELHNRQEEYRIRENSLEKQISSEEKRSEDLEELKKYVKTKKYVEDVAKEKLGLVYDNEIIFKAANN